MCILSQNREIDASIYSADFGTTRRVAGLHGVWSAPLSPLDRPLSAALSLLEADVRFTYLHGV